MIPSRVGAIRCLLCEAFAQQLPFPMDSPFIKRAFHEGRLVCLAETSCVCSRRRDTRSTTAKLILKRRDLAEQLRKGDGFRFVVGHENKAKAFLETCA